MSRGHLKPSNCSDNLLPMPYKIVRKLEVLLRSYYIRICGPGFRFREDLDEVFFCEFRTTFLILVEYCAPCTNLVTMQVNLLSRFVPSQAFNLKQRSRLKMSRR